MNNLNRPKGARLALHASVSPGRRGPVRDSSQPRDGSSKPRVPTDYIRHRRMASLTFKQNAAPKGSQLVTSGNYSLFQKYCRAARTEKPTPLISPRTSTMKSLMLTEIYTSKPMYKTAAGTTTHHQQVSNKLNTTTVIKPGQEFRRGSTGSRQFHKTQYCAASSRRRSRECISTPQSAKRNAEAGQLVQEGIEAVKRHELAAAIDCFNNAATMFPNNPEVYLNRGIAYLEDNAPGKAAKVKLSSQKCTL